MGIGRRETPKPFVNACVLFVYTTNLDSESKTTPEKTKSESDWTPAVRNAIETASQDDEWVYLSLVGKCLRDLEPAFDPRTFGHKKLSDLIKSRPDLFQMRVSKKLTEVRLAP
jgi:hypothetical protein